MTTSEDCTARLWDIATGTMLTPPLKQLGSVRLRAFSPDSRSYVITASTDNTARVWDATTGEPVTPGLKFTGSPIGAPSRPTRRFKFALSGATRNGPRPGGS